jgi:signal transduction histidine kinase
VDQRRSGNGAVNMRNRAEDRRGKFSLVPAEPRGTVLTWTVLLDS